MKSQLERDKLFSLSSEPSAWGAAEHCCSLPCCQSYKIRCSGWEWNRMSFSRNLQVVWFRVWALLLYPNLISSSWLFCFICLLICHPPADKDTECGFAPCPKAGTGTGGGSLVREEAQTGRYGASLQEQLLAVHKLHLTWQICCCPSGDSFIRFDALLWICVSVLPLEAAGLLTPSSSAQSSGTRVKTEPNHCSFIGFSLTVLGQIVGCVCVFFFLPKFDIQIQLT